MTDRMWIDGYPCEAKRRVDALIAVLEPIVKRDPEQDILGIAVPVVEAALDAINAALPKDPVVMVTLGAYEHEFEAAELVRCVDALIVATQLAAAIGPSPSSKQGAVRPVY